MKELFVPYKLALLAKERGFDGRCLAHYCGFGDGSKEKDNPDKYNVSDIRLFIAGEYPTSTDIEVEKGLHCFVCCRVPLYQQLVDWFRDTYKIHLYVDAYGEQYYYGIRHENWEYYNRLNCEENGYRYYYEALNKALEEAFSLIQ